MKRKFRILSCGILMTLAVSCVGRGGGEGESVRHFPEVNIPSICTEPSERIEYALMHMWDDFEGVGMDEIEVALSNFIRLLEEAPMPVAQKAMGNLFDKICAAEKADTSAHRYVLMTQLVSKYLYDPNSPLRNEDYYLPFVSRMSESELTSEDMKQAYRFEAESCSICQFGTEAPDFTIRKKDGRNIRLHAVKANRIMLFFSNPGCTACKEIIDQIQSVPQLVQLVGSGEVAVVNVYIDEDLDAWSKYVVNYPENWTSGYDLAGVIRGERLYDVRAIPSLYLLDTDKHILMKDAPVDKVIAKILDQ